MNRRTFLAACAAGALPGLLAACGTGPNGVATVTPVPTRQPSPTPTPTRQPSPTLQSSPTAADWTALSHSLQGTLVQPGSPRYPTALQLFNTRFDGIRPAAIAYCTSIADVQACLAFVRRFGVPVALRAGGHSYAGYSTTTGLVLDVSSMNAVMVDAGAGTALVGAGARLIDVYAALAQQGLALPAGSCPTVGISGLTLGGGVGVLGRKFGLTCDNLLAANIVLADGSVLNCDASQYADLFWALRGGGGGNFGVVTSFLFQVHPVSTLSLFTLNWPWSVASDVVDAWQNWAPQAPDELWSNCLLLTSTSTEPIVRANGVYVGAVASLEPLLQQLTSRVGTAPSSSYVSGVGLLETMMDEAGCYGMSVGECHLPGQNPQGQLQRATFSAKSDYFSSALPRQGSDVLVSAIAGGQDSSVALGILLDAFGGAFNRVATDATAFVHRDALFSAQYTANWHASDPSSVASASQTWLTGTWQAMRPYASGFAYQNYIDPDLPNWQTAYYGANLARLQQVKAAYDPGNLFRFAQSIPEPG